MKPLIRSLYQASPASLPRRWRKLHRDSTVIARSCRNHVGIRSQFLFLVWCGLVQPSDLGTRSRSSSEQSAPQIGSKVVELHGCPDQPITQKQRPGKGQYCHQREPRKTSGKYVIHGFRPPSEPSGARKSESNLRACWSLRASASSRILRV